MQFNITKTIQILFGCILLLFGLNGFFAFLPLPEKQGVAAEFLHALHQVNYLLPMVATIMTTVGILLLSNRWVAFALLMQLPISVNIFAFHLLHDWQGLVAAYIIFACNNFLILRRLKQYKILFNKDIVYETVKNS